MSAAKFIEGLVAAMGADAGVIERSGTTAVADVSRAGTRRVGWYQIQGHTLLPCDPDVLQSVEGLSHASVSLSDTDFRLWVDGNGGSVVGQAVMKVAGAAGLQLVPPVAGVHLLDWSAKADLELMQAFVDTCEASDLDEAEVDMDDLDDAAIALLTDDGAIGAYASSRPFEDELPFGDIGILTSPRQRNRGWGSLAVSALVRDVLMPRGIDPLYRCDPANVGSHRLSAALGFEIVASLTVAELPGT